MDLLAAMELLFWARRLVKQHMLCVKLHRPAFMAQSILACSCCSSVAPPPLPPPPSVHTSSMTCQQAASSTGTKEGRRIHGGDFFTCSKSR